MFVAPMWAGGGWRQEPEAPSLVFGDMMDAGKGDKILPWPPATVLVGWRVVGVFGADVGRRRMEAGTRGTITCVWRHDGRWKGG